jgi:hypothetical protein
VETALPADAAVVSAKRAMEGGGSCPGDYSW